MELRQGHSRTVIITRKWAFKFPSLRHWRGFLYGLLNNMAEVEWSGFNQSFCPVRFSLPGGFLVVMPRCAPVDASYSDEMEEICLGHFWIEDKLDSFGILNGQVVAVDYGDYRNTR